MRWSQRTFSAARRLSRASGVSGRRRTGSVPGQVNLSRLVLTKETLRPSLAKRSASALISGSGFVTLRDELVDGEFVIGQGGGHGLKELQNLSVPPPPSGEWNRIGPVQNP